MNVDLRARTRAAVREQVAHVAWDLFAERGFDAVTIDDVCAAAGISRASFFRYFGTKEEAVLAAQELIGDDVVRAIEAAPRQPDVWKTLRDAFQTAGGFARGEASAVSDALARARLVQETPSLRARQLEKQTHKREAIALTLATRAGRAEPDLQDEALAAAAVGVVDAALQRWVAGDGREPLDQLVDAAFAALRPARRPR